MSGALSSRVAVPTAMAERYVQQLCKHWAHNLEVSYDNRHGKVIFPRNARGADWPGDAILTLTAVEEALHMQLDASAPAQLEGLKGAISRHLDRFAFREAPLRFDWTDE